MKCVALPSNKRPRWWFSQVVGGGVVSFPLFLSAIPGGVIAVFLSIQPAAELPPHTSSLSMCCDGEGKKMEVNHTLRVTHTHTLRCACGRFPCCCCLKIIRFHSFASSFSRPPFFHLCSCFFPSWWVVLVGGGTATRHPVLLHQPQ